jgi:peptide chain release factor 2
MTDELISYEFHKEGELTAEELDEQPVENHIDAIEFKICFRMKEIL